MSKHPTSKSKAHRTPSLHSRAARRATSPTLNTDKSLLSPTIKPPSYANAKTTHIFSAAHNAGISKKKKNKQLKRGQLERQRKGVERAGIVQGQMEAKVERSLGRLKAIKERRREWEGVNREAERFLEVGGKGMFGALDVEGEEKEEKREEVSGVDTVMEMALPVRTLPVAAPVAVQSAEAIAEPVPEQPIEPVEQEKTEVKPSLEEEDEVL